MAHPNTGLLQSEPVRGRNTPPADDSTQCQPHEATISIVLMAQHLLQVPCNRFVHVSPKCNTMAVDDIVLSSIWQHLQAQHTQLRQQPHQQHPQSFQLREPDRRASLLVGTIQCVSYTPGFENMARQLCLRRHHVS